jgi:hypothetical protein
MNRSIGNDSSRRLLCLTIVFWTIALLASCVGCAREAQSSAPTSDRRAEPSAAASPEAAPAAPSEAPPPGMERDEEAPAQQPSAAQSLQGRSSLEGPSAPQADKKSSARDDAVSQLSVETGQFAKAIAPEQLSCDSARPHRDAICEIATRICELSSKSPSSTGSDCESAKSSCVDARRKYKERCEK